MSDCCDIVSVWGTIDCHGCRYVPAGGGASSRAGVVCRRIWPYLYLCARRLRAMAVSVVMVAVCGNMSGCRFCGTPAAVAMMQDTASVRYFYECREYEKSLKTIRIIFGGDVMQHIPQIVAAQRDTVDGYAQSFRYLSPMFDSADLVVLNLETTLSPDDSYSGYPHFSSPRGLAGALKRSGVDVLMLANNHICDKGGPGIGSTVAALADAGLVYTGVFADSADYRRNHPLFLDVKGIKLAFLNYTYGTNGIPVPKGKIVNLIDTVRIAADLEGIDRAQTDYVVVFFHWGQEYARRPDGLQKTLARWCHDRGVEFVIGSHPHVLQPMETLTDGEGNVKGITVYSLGNLVSNQRWRYSDGGALVQVDITHSNRGKPVIKPSYQLVWVDMPVVSGSRQYRILPSYIADTMLRGSASLWAYSRFMTDGRMLLSGVPGFPEIGGGDGTTDAASVPDTDTDADIAAGGVENRTVSHETPVYPCVPTNGSGTAAGNGVRSSL